MKRLFAYLFIGLMFCTVSLKASDIGTQLQVLKKLQDDGVITQEEFNNAKSILLEKDQAKTESVASLPEKLIPTKEKSIGDDIIKDLQIYQTNDPKSKRSWEKMEIIYKDYRIYISRPGTIKVQRISDNKQLLAIQGNMNVKYYNNSEGLFDIDIIKKERPSIDEDLATAKKQIEETIKNPLDKLKKILLPKSILKKDKSYNEEPPEPKEEIKLTFKIDGKKLLHWEGRWVTKHKAFFYQVLSSGYQPFHFYIVLRGRSPFALNMKFFNMRIDKAIRKAKKRLAIEYDISEAEIDKIIERETGRATEEATQEAVAEAVSAEVSAAIAQTIGEAMSEGVINAIEAATGEAIDAALEAELAAAIDAEIAYAVSQGIEEAAVTAGWQAYFDTLAAGGTVEQASANAYEACGSACDNY